MPHRMLRQNFTRKRAILSHVQFHIFQHTPAKINSPPLKNLEYRRKCLAAHLKKLLSLQIFGCLKAPAGFALHSARINSVPAQQKLHGLRVKKELKIKYKMVAFFPYE